MSTELRTIVLACDEAYAMPLATTLRSMVEANQPSWPLQCYILAHNMTETSQHKVLNSLPSHSATIHWVPVDLSLFRDFSTVPYVSKMTYTRLLIPKIIPEGVQRVLYIDTDVLVLDDLSPLWLMDLADVAIGAVLDAGLDNVLRERKPPFEKLPPVRRYFNAGVLLINLKVWRKAKISERALQYLASHPDTPYMDQDALNFACDGLWAELDSRWNFQNHFKIRISTLSLVQRPAVVHFVTSVKPWKASTCSVNAIFYDSFRGRTCFGRTWNQRFQDGISFVWSKIKGMVRDSYIGPILIGLRGKLLPHGEL
jgi:lipopolysaccharide biosynthesis glycosyltransferase